MQERKRYSKEFKQDAVSLVLEQGYSRAEAARNLGINMTIMKTQIAKPWPIVLTAPSVLVETNKTR